MFFLTKWRKIATKKEKITQIRHLSKQRKFYYLEKPAAATCYQPRVAGSAVAWSQFTTRGSLRGRHFSLSLLFACNYMKLASLVPTSASFTSFPGVHISDLAILDQNLQLKISSETSSCSQFFFLFFFVSFDSEREF
jgi:hypothetical protein